MTRVSRQYVLGWLLRLVAFTSWVIAIVWFIDSPGYEPLLTALAGIAAFLASKQAPLSSDAKGKAALFPVDCGDRSLDLGQQRLIVSKAFGSYFTGLLERDTGYVLLPGQIDCPPIMGFEAAEPIQRLFWALHHPRGPRVILIAAEGGMGKSTLATKIIRCMYEQSGIDMILGDSAKTEQIDPISGELRDLIPGYYDIDSFHRKLSDQLAIPNRPLKGVHSIIRDRLEGRHALIVVDNLETVQNGETLLHSLQEITSRDVRAIVTSRTTSGFDPSSGNVLVVRLKPLTDLDSLRKFLFWHIQQYQMFHPALSNLGPELARADLLHKLADQTGGIPLLIQILFSNVANHSWAYLDALPALFGIKLLNFLYYNHWEELENLGQAGKGAIELLHWISGEQYRHNKISRERLTGWAADTGRISHLEESLNLLHERFMLVNMDKKQGSYAIAPSLAAFVQGKRE